MKRPFIAVTALTLATAISFTSVAEERPASEKRLHTVQINSLEDLKAYFRYDPKRDIIVSGHRGGMMPGYPENCIESCEKTLSMMPTFFEIDFSFTKDSVMVLMHDLTIDRTTNGKGRVADYTYEELQRFRLVDRDGNVTDYRIPTLAEVLEWGKDKVAFNFDNKYINTKGVGEAERRRALDYYVEQLLPGGAWSEYHNIFLSVRSLDEALYYWNAGVRNAMFCIEISTPEQFRAFERSGIPWSYLIAASRKAMDPAMTEIYEKLHDRGVMVIVSVTGSADRVKDRRDRRVEYLRTLLSEPDIIETDYPADFVGLPVGREELRAIRDREAERIERRVCRLHAVRRSEEQRVFGQKVEERLPVVLRDGNVLLAEDDAVAFDRADLRRLHDEGAVDADEPVGGQLFFQRFETGQREHGMRLLLDVDLHVIFQPLDIENPLQLDLPQPVFGLDEEALRSCGRRGRFGTVFQFEPCQRLVRRCEEVGIADRFEQVVDRVDAEAFDGVAAESCGEDHARVGGEHPRELHAVQPRHLNIAEKQIDRTVAQHAEGRDAAAERALQLQKGGLPDVRLHQFHGQRLIVDYRAAQFHSSGSSMHSSA